MSSTYAGVRDGKPALLKRCEDCGQEKVVSADRRVSEFHVRFRPLADGTKSPGWGPTCIECTRRIRRERYAQLSEEQKRRRAKENWRRLLASPDRHSAAKLLRREWHAQRIAAMSEAEREAWYQRRREQTRRWSARRVQEDPEFYRRVKRRARSEKFQEQQRAQQVTDISMERIDIEPLRRAVDEWLARDPAHSYALLAERIGVGEVRLERFEHVAVDLADRIALAIGESFELIYPYEEAA